MLKSGMFDNVCHAYFYTRSRGYKPFFMLSSIETKIYPAHKC